MKGNRKMPKPSATISLDQDQPVGEAISFHVTTTIKNPYLAWVANKCFDANGVVVISQYLPVQWPDGTAGDFATRQVNPDGSVIQGVTGLAYAFEYPNTETPLAHADYTIAS